MSEVKAWLRKKWCSWIIKWFNKTLDRPVQCLNLCRWECHLLCKCLLQCKCQILRKWRCHSPFKCQLLLNRCPWMRIKSLISSPTKFLRISMKMTLIWWLLILLPQACTTFKTSKLHKTKLSNLYSLKRRLLPANWPPLSLRRYKYKALRKAVWTSLQWWATLKASPWRKRGRQKN